MSLVSLAATAMAVWLTTRLAWRIGGANTALVSALLMCCNPQTLEMAISPSNGSVGLCLMLASVFGFQRHLEGTSVRLSTSLIVSGFVWGLLMLSELSIVAPQSHLLFSLHALNQRMGNQPEFANPSVQNQLLQSRTILRSTFYLLGIGLFVSAWWGFVIGQNGFQSWCDQLAQWIVSLRETKGGEAICAH